MKRRILVVEDSPTQAELIRFLLEGAGYQVDLAGNGREGLNKVQGAPPDLIISDVVMPEMDGYAFCQAVKSAERTRRIPFVLLTQRNTPQDILWGLTRGADNFIAKPFDDEYLLERVKRIFEHLELRRKGQLEVDVTLRLGEREIVINPDKQQIVELLFSTFEDVCRLNNELLDAKRKLEDYATNLEAMVQERTAALRLLNRDLRVISLCNQILVRAASEEELLRGICHTIVGVGEHRAAWVGFVTEWEERHVRPVAVEGCEPGLVDSHAMDPADPAWGTCPVTLAIGTGMTQVVQNIPGNPPRCPWHDEAVRLGIGSSISLPLKDGERSFGALTIYSALLDRFNAEEVSLLGELANDLAYGIQAIRTRAAHERALAEIESLARFPNENPSPVMRVREDGVILYANAPSEPLLRLWETAVGTRMPADWIARIRHALETRTQESVDLSCDDRVYSIITAPVPEEAYVNLYGRDITERKRAEEGLATRTRQLEAIRAVNEEITRELDLRAVLDLITRRAVDLVGASSAMLRLWQEDTGLLVPQSFVGLEERRGTLSLRLGEGVAGAVAQRRQGLVVNDFRHSPYTTPPLLELTTHIAVLSEPLLYRDRLIGVVNLNRKEPGRPFSEEDRQLLALLAAQAAIAIENARLYSEALEKTDRLEGLTRTSAKVTGTLRLEEVLDAIVEEAARLLRVEGAGFRLLEGDRLVVGSQYGLAHHVMLQPSLRVGESLSGLVVEQGRPIAVPDMRENQQHLPEHRAAALAHGVVASLGVPVRYRDRIIGELSVYGKERRMFSEEEIRLLSVFADHAAIAIENARLYQEIRDYAATLEQRVQERTQELAAANQQLQDASRHKSEFLANMSHEIRTPLNSIIGFAELLWDQSVGPLTERQARYLTHIANGGKHLVQLIGDILDISKVEAGKFVLQPEPLPVAQTLEDILVIARGLANKKAQEIQVEIAPDLSSLTADPVRFKQILFNLLSNAVKFTPNKGTITLRAYQKSEGRQQKAESRRQTAEGSGQTSGDLPPLPTAECPLPTADCLLPSLVIEVTDTGVGIKPEDLPRLFQEFVQLETTQAQRHEGSGLGLALTKRLVELHGGRIWAESEGEGRGSTFTVVLPFAGPGT